MMHRSSQWKTGLVFAVAASGILVNAAYAGGNLQQLLNTEVTLPARQALAAAASLEFGWVLLLLWFLFDPERRRGVLLLSIPPILSASLAYSLLDGKGGMVLAANLALALGYSGLYLVAYRLAGKKPDW